MPGNQRMVIHPELTELKEYSSKDLPCELTHGTRVMVMACADIHAIAFIHDAFAGVFRGKTEDEPNDVSASGTPSHVAARAWLGLSTTPEGPGLVPSPEVVELFGRPGERDELIRYAESKIISEAK